MKSIALGHHAAARNGRQQPRAIDGNGKTEKTTKSRVLNSE